MGKVVGYVDHHPSALAQKSEAGRHELGQSGYVLQDVAGDNGVEAFCTEALQPEAVAGEITSKPSRFGDISKKVGTPFGIDVDVQDVGGPGLATAQVDDAGSAADVRTAASASRRA